MTLDDSKVYDFRWSSDSLWPVGLKEGPWVLFIFHLTVCYWFCANAELELCAFQHMGYISKTKCLFYCVF